MMDGTRVYVEKKINQMTKVHNAHRLGTINSGGPRYGASRYRTNCHMIIIHAISPTRIQIIQAGQNEPSILSIGSQAVKKTAKITGKAVFRDLGRDIIICA